MLVQNSDNVCTRAIWANDSFCPPPTPPTRHKEKNTMARLVLEPRPLGPESSAPTILPPPLWVQSHSDHLSGWYCFGYSWNFYSSIQLDCWWTSAANEWDVELNTRREIPYLQATIYYSLFNIHLDFGPLLVSVSMIVYPYFGTNYYNSIAIIPAYSDLAIRKG